MLKKKIKRNKQNKRKKPTVDLIRTDVWQLKVPDYRKKILLLTIEQYRKFLRPLVLIINNQWTNLSDLDANKRINTVEKLIHTTTKNSNPKHAYFKKIVSKIPSFRKFPSYLRRATIAEALGIVSSFQTRYRDWQSGIRTKRTAKPPILTLICKSYPALYKGQQISYNKNFSSVNLKVWNGFDWIWMEKVKIKNYGGNRHLTEGNEIQSPALVVNKQKCQLSVPIKIKRTELSESDFVCSVDMGINNAATCSIVGKDGTVKARKFINPARDIDRRNKRRMMIAKKSKQTHSITKEKFQKSFCKGLYRKSANINLQISRTITKQIVNFASLNNVKIIVFENLEGWKAKAGKKKTLLKQKFHLWCHRKIVNSVTEKWNELGGETQTINPKYTSAYAFDGSGKVKRSNVNYSLCKFKSGKSYNADLNASYNIGARYWYCLLTGDRNFSKVFDSESSDGTLRTPITLGTLRQLALVQS